MDKLFISEQAIPPSTLTTATVTAGNHLATIANTMSTAVSGAGLTSKVAANHADADREETIDFKDMPADLRARYALKKHPVDIFRKSDLALYHNVLTIDKHGTVQDWRTIEYPEIGLGNTTKHDAQTYLCMLDGSIFGHLDYQNNKHKSAFLAGAPDIWLNGHQRGFTTYVWPWKWLVLLIVFESINTFFEDVIQKVNRDSPVPIKTMMLMLISESSTNQK